MKHIGICLRADRPGSQSHRSARSRIAGSVVKFALLASLVVSPNADPLAQGGSEGASPPMFQSEVTDQFGGVRRPTRIAISNDGRIHVSDTLRGVVAIFDTAGRRVGTLTGFQEPLGLAVSVFKRCNRGCGAKCRVVRTAYVGDQADGSVAVFENGRRVRWLGAGAGEFVRPNGVAATRAQVSYVLDTEAAHVKVFRPDGSLDGTFGSFGWGNGQFEYPIDIALNEAAGEIYVADFGDPEWDSQRIAVFDLDGAWLRNLYPPDDDQGNPAFYRIAGLGVGPAGNLYVVDSALASVAIITPNGILVDIIGYRLGSYWNGELEIPIDAATNGKALYVTSSNDRLVKVFEAVQ